MEVNIMQVNTRPLHGIMLTLLATLLFAGHDTLSKHLSNFYPVVMIVWARYLVHTLLMAAVLLPRTGLTILHSQRPVLQGLRSLFLLGSSLLFTSGLMFIPLAEATAVNFLAPLLVTVLSVWLLNERVSFGQWLAVIVGFIGVLVIVRPDGAFFTLPILLPFGSALCFCAYQLLSRKVAECDKSTTSNFFAGLQNTVLMTLLVPFFWHFPDNSKDALFMLALGGLGMLGHLSLSQAFHCAAPALLAPFSYCQLAFAALLGLLFFRHWPDANSLLGISLVCVSGLAAALLQQWRKLKSKV